MRIVITGRTSLGDVRKFPRRLFLDFYDKLKYWHTVFHYGPREHRVNPPSVTPVVYDERLTLYDIQKEFNADLIFVFAWVLNRTWLKVKTRATVPVACVEADYWYVEDNKSTDWYAKTGVDLIIQRGPNPKTPGVPSVWLPLSVPEDEFFNREPWANRIKKIFFMGRKNHSIYKHRRTVLKKVKQLKLLAEYDFEDDTANRELYPYLLESHRASITCAGGPRIGMALARTFESMASGTVVLTPPFKCSDVLFDEKCWYTYKWNFRNLEDKCKTALNDVGQSKAMADLAYKQMRSRHMHKHRLVELNNILMALVNGGEMPNLYAY
jgi:hypothetical protein